MKEFKGRQFQRGFAGWVAAGVAVAGATGIIGDHGAGDANAASADANKTSAAASKTQAQIAQDQWNQYKTTFQPLETDLAAKAKTYGTPEEQEAAAGRANADVTSSFDATRKAQQLGLSGSRGLNPNDPAYAATVGSTNLSEAASKAGAETQARIQARDQGFAKELDAIGIGKGIPASSANTLGNVAATTGIRGSQAFNQAQQLNTQQAQGVYGIANLAQKGFNTWSGGGTNDGRTNSSGWTSDQANNYDGSGVNSDSAVYVRDGGIIKGRGTETSDSNPAMLSKNEAVLNAGAVRIIGVKAIHKLNEMGKLARGGIHKRHPISLPAKLMHLHGE